MLLKKAFLNLCRETIPIAQPIIRERYNSLPLTRAQRKLSIKSFYRFRRIIIFGEVNQLSATLSKMTNVFLFIKAAVFQHTKFNVIGCKCYIRIRVG